jgi:hypothetical protein
VASGLDRSQVESLKSLKSIPEYADTFEDVTEERSTNQTPLRPNQSLNKPQTLVPAVVPMATVNNTVAAEPEATFQETDDEENDSEILALRRKISEAQSVLLQKRLEAQELKRANKMRVTAKLKHEHAKLQQKINVGPMNRAICIKCLS